MAYCHAIDLDMSPIGTVLKLCSAEVNVVDQETGNPTTNATVSAYYSTYNWQPDSVKGNRYRFSEIYTGLDSFYVNMYVDAPDYEDRTVAVQILKGLCTNVTIDLIPEDDCGTAPSSVPVASGRSLLPALLPLGVALAAILSWVLLRKASAAA